MFSCKTDTTATKNVFLQVTNVISDTCLKEIIKPLKDLIQNFLHVLHHRFNFFFSPTNFFIRTILFTSVILFSFFARYLHKLTRNIYYISYQRKGTKNLSLLFRVTHSSMKTIQRSYTRNNNHHWSYTYTNLKRARQEQKCSYFLLIRAWLI